MRARRPKHLEERFDWYSEALESDPVSCAGQWAARHLPGAREVRLDLGCGKGEFIIQLAQREPDVLFVGIDNEKICAAMAAKNALESGLKNVVFVLGDGDDVAKMFGPGELSLIYLNFCAPFPRSKAASKRLTHVDRLMTYRDVLAPGATVRFKTDSQPLFDFSLIQFELAGYELLWQTRDLHEFNPDEVQSAFEVFLSGQKGAKVHALLAQPGPRPETWEQTAPLRLADYLPEDLEHMEYIPYGMEDTVRNAINRRRNLERAAKNAAREAAKKAARKAAKEAARTAKSAPQDAPQDAPQPTPQPVSQLAPQAD